MNRINIIIILIILISCSNKKPSLESIEVENMTAKQVDSVLTEFKFEYETPIILDSSDIVMFPISTKLLEKRSVFASDGYWEEDHPRYWNVLFYNRLTGETNLLTKNKYRISQIHTSKKHYDNDYDKIVVINKIMYEICDNDYNKDGKLNSEDPDHLFLSDENGKKLIRVSPLNEDLRYFEVVPKTDQILIQTKRDTYRDSIFNKKDKSFWYKVEKNGEDWITNEIVDSLKRSEIENLYFSQWLIKNKTPKTSPNKDTDSISTNDRER